jgi:RNA polymerase sigma-70 factor (ECF subfamily)
MTDSEEQFPQTIPELEKFIKRHQHKLVRHAFFKLGNLQDAEDVVQNTFIKMYTERNGFNHVAKPLPYTFRMVSNLCIDKLRSEAKIDNEQLNGSEEAHTLTGIPHEEEIIRREEFRRINTLLGKLPKEQAEVLRMRIIDELSFVEISAILETPVNTVKSRFKYGIDKLRFNLMTVKEVKNEV